MPYKFNFDLSNVPKQFFEDLIKASYKRNLHRRLAGSARTLVKKFKLEEITGLTFSDAISLVEDLIEIYSLNLLYKDKMKNKNKKALFLPHCARKYMDSRCKAIFDSSLSTYICQSCSEDCLINVATRLGKSKGYDVYVVPGGSCIPGIVRRGGYEAVVGVACGMELKLAAELIRNFNIPGQAVPLTKNGCAHTKFDLEELEKIL
jgi:hypothetical protein